MADQAVNITRFLITISIMLFTAKVLGELFTLIKQPAVIGEIIAGLIIGPTILGKFFPSLYYWIFPGGYIIPSIEGIITLAVVLLLLVSGLEVDLTIVLKQGKPAIYTGLLGIIIPFTIGFSLVFGLPDIFEHVTPFPRILLAAFIGTAMAISALPVIAKILMDIGIFKTELGSVIISAAMFNDTVGWLIFSVILGYIGTSNHPFSIGVTVLITFSFAIIAVLFLRRIINRSIPFIQEKISYPGGILSFIFIIGLLGASFTEYIGVHAIFGSFIMGIAIGNSVNLNDEVRENLNQFVTNLFAPLFFVSIGLRVNFWEDFNLILVLVIVIVTFIGKVSASGLGAYLGGMDKKDALAVGFGMSSTGAMGIILGLIALEANLINQELYVALVILAIVTSISSAPIMNYIIRKKRITLTGILKPELVFFTDFKSKEEIIKHLAGSVSNYHKLNEEEILAEVMKRENDSPTGIANYLALPHGRINFKKTVIAAAVNKSGIDFGALDGEESRIIFLLLTPKNNNELQLRLLSEIGQKFRNRNKAEEYLTAKNPQEFVKLINKN